MHGIGFDGAEKDAAEVEIVGPCGAITRACAILDADDGNGAGLISGGNGEIMIK